MLTGAALLALAAITATAEDKKTPPIPDKLTTCPVSGDKLGGDMASRSCSNTKDAK